METIYLTDEKSHKMTEICYIDPSIRIQNMAFENAAQPNKKMELWLNFEACFLVGESFKLATTSVGHRKKLFRIPWNFHNFDNLRDVVVSFSIQFGLVHDKSFVISSIGV